MSRRLNWFLAALILVAISASAGIAYFSARLSDTEIASHRADIFGGLVSPLLTFLTFVALVVTLRIQSEELRLSRREFELTRAELERSSDALEHQSKSLAEQTLQRTFLELLQTLNSISASIVYTSYDDTQYVGRTAFQRHYKLLRNSYRNRRARAKKTRSERQIVLVTYKRFWRVSQGELGHYFRFLYRIFKFLLESDLDTTLYLKLLRAQLSDDELGLLFYNGLSKEGHRFGELAPMVCLFNNLPGSMLMRREHRAWYSAEAFTPTLDPTESKNLDVIP